MRKRRATCKACGDPPKKGTRISARGLCNGCSAKRQIDAILAMKNREGELARRWEQNRRQGAIRWAKGLEALMDRDLL